MRPKRIPLQEEAPLFSYDTGRDKPIVVPENAMVMSGNSFRGHKFKNAVTSLINCELAKDDFGCLSNFNSAVSTIIGGVSGCGPFLTVGPASSCADYKVDGTDDHVQINQALSDLGSSGGTVFLFPGTYVINDTIEIAYSNTNLIGAGFGTIIKIKNSSSFASGDYAIKTKSYCQVRDMQINGNKGNNTYGGGIYVYESPRCMFSRLYIYDCSESAILSEGTASDHSSHANKYTDISILDCEGYGIFMHTYSYDCEFLNVWIGRCNVGYRVEDSDNCLTNLHVWECASDGVQIRADYTRIYNAYIETNIGKGIDIFNKKGCTIGGSTIRGNQQGGINIASANKNVVTGCVIINNTGFGVTVSGTGANNLISSNQFFDTAVSKAQTYGIKTDVGTTKTLVIGNYVLTSDHGTAGLSLAGTGDTNTGNITT